MEKRATRRHLPSTTIVCSVLNSVNLGEPGDGRMKNCCVSGLHAELRFCFKAGTVLAVRVTGSSCGYSWEEGFRMKDLHQADDLRVLDCDGHRVFRNFTLGKLGQPMYHEPDLPGYSLLERTLKQEAVMIETHNDVIRLPARQHL